MGVHDVDNTFWENTNPTDVSIDTMNSEELMSGSHIAEFHTPKDKEITPEDSSSQVNQHYDSQHDQQLMAPTCGTDHEYQNTSDSTSNLSADDELVTQEDESIPSIAMQDQDHANIKQELATLVSSNRITVQEFINDMVCETVVPTNQL